MKMHTYYFIILVVLSVWQAAAAPSDIETGSWGNPTNGIQMSISLKGGGREIMSKKAIKLLLHFKALSINALPMLSLQNIVEGDDSFSFTVISPTGKDISPSSEPRFIPGSGSSTDLRPNQKPVVLEYDLSQRCRFDEIGNYSIIAKTKMWSHKFQKQFTVVSNPLTVTVIPAKQ